MLKIAHQESDQAQCSTVDCKQTTQIKAKLDGVKQDLCWKCVLTHTLLWEGRVHTSSEYFYKHKSLLKFLTCLIEFKPPSHSYIHPTFLQEFDLTVEMIKRCMVEIQLKEQTRLSNMAEIFEQIAKIVKLGLLPLYGCEFIDRVIGGEEGEEQRLVGKLDAIRAGKLDHQDEEVREEVKHESLKPEWQMEDMRFYQWDQEKSIFMKFKNRCQIQTKGCKYPDPLTLPKQCSPNAKMVSKPTSDQLIAMQMKPGKVYQYDIAISHMGKHGECKLGIADDTFRLQEGFVGDQEGTWAYWGDSLLMGEGHQTKCENLVRFKAGDVITVRVDKVAGELSFSHNGGEFVVGFKDDRIATQVHYATVGLRRSAIQIQNMLIK